MNKFKVHKILSRLHKLMGLIVGIQLFLWVLGGFFMSYFPIEEVRSEHMRAEITNPPLTQQNYYPIHKIENWGDYETITLENFYGDPIYRTTTVEGDTILFDALTGKKLSPLPEAKIKSIATANYAGPHSIKSMKLLTEDREKPDDYGRALPVWQVVIDGDDGLNLYIHPDTGRIMAWRSDLWRFFDLMWRLHIMDYDTGEDFNHPLLVSFAAAAVLFILTGVGLMTFRLRKRDFTAKL